MAAISRFLTKPENFPMPKITSFLSRSRDEKRRLRQSKICLKIKKVDFKENVLAEKRRTAKTERQARAVLWQLCAVCPMKTIRPVLPASSFCTKFIVRKDARQSIFGTSGWSFWYKIVIFLYQNHHLVGTGHSPRVFRLAKSGGCASGKFVIF